MTVQLVIMVVALAVYGFAPYAWDLIDTRDTVLESDGNYNVLMKREVGNVWAGPRQQDLVILGALYAPCMRWDFRLFREIEADRQRENSSSGCCVRRDRGGCFQADSVVTCSVSGCGCVCGVWCVVCFTSLYRSALMTLYSLLRTVVQGLSVEHRHGNRLTLYIYIL